MVISFRSPDVERYRVILLLARGLSGFVFGFANINNLGTLLDVFGASLQSSKSHESLANPYDVRRHGGGMGVWLAIWSWCTTGSIALGFVIGAFIISGAAVDWGFWVSLTLLMGVLLLNVIAPEVRRSAFRRTIAEIIGEGGSFSRVARGEVKLHLTGNGPYWWGEEVKAGLQLSWKMVKQPGFLILSIYAAWAYAQFTLILMVSLHDGMIGSKADLDSCWEHSHPPCTVTVQSTSDFACFLSLLGRHWRYHSRRLRGSAVLDTTLHGPTA
jgi:MFS family permease